MACEPNKKTNQDSGLIFRHIAFKMEERIFLIMAQKPLSLLARNNKNIVGNAVHRSTDRHLGDEQFG
jgi:hypothetical protein